MEKHQEFQAEKPKSLRLNSKQMFYTPQQDKYDGYTQQPSPKSPPYYNIMNNPKIRKQKESLVDIKPNGIEQKFKSELNQNVYNPPIDNCSFISGTIKNYKENLENKSITKLDYAKQKTIVIKRPSELPKESKNIKSIQTTPKNPPQQFKIINGKILTIPNQSALQKKRQKQNDILNSSQITPRKTNMTYTYNPKQKIFTAVNNNSRYENKSNDISNLFGQSVNSVIENSFVKQNPYNNFSQQWSKDMESTNNTQQIQYQSKFYIQINNFTQQFIISAKSSMRHDDKITNVSVERYLSKVRHRSNRSQYMKKDCSNESLLNSSLYEEYSELKRSNSNINISRVFNNQSQYLTKTFSKFEIIPDQEPQTLKSSQSFIQKMDLNKFYQDISEYVISLNSPLKQKLNIIFFNKSNIKYHHKE